MQTNEALDKSADLSLMNYALTKERDLIASKESQTAARVAELDSALGELNRALTTSQLAASIKEQELHGALIATQQTAQIKEQELNRALIATQESAESKAQELIAVAAASQEKELTHALEEKRKENSELKGLYQQLKMQFEEKNLALLDARRDLFKTEGKLLALQREVELAEVDRTEVCFLEKS